MANTTNARRLLTEIRAREAWWMDLGQIFNPAGRKTVRLDYQQAADDSLKSKTLAQLAAKVARSLLRDANRNDGKLQEKLQKKRLPTDTLDVLYAHEAKLRSDIAAIETHPLGGTATIRISTNRLLAAQLQGALHGGKYDRALAYLERQRPSGLRDLFKSKTTKQNINADIDSLIHKVRAHQSMSAQRKTISESISISERATVHAIKDMVRRFDPKLLDPSTNPRLIGLMASNEAVRLAVNYATGVGAVGRGDILNDIRSSKGAVSTHTLREGLDFLFINLESDYRNEKGKHELARDKLAEFKAYSNSCRSQALYETMYAGAGARRVPASTHLENLINDPATTQEQLDKAVREIGGRLNRGANGWRQAQIEADAHKLANTAMFMPGTVDTSLRGAFSRASRVVNEGLNAVRHVIKSPGEWKDASHHIRHAFT